MSDKPKGYVFGRPTKYREEYCQEIINFFNREPFEPWLKKDGEPMYNKFGEPIMKPALFPTFEKFAFEIGVHVDTLHEWKRVHPDFSDAFTQAKYLQKDILSQNGLQENYNAGFAKFVAINCTDMVDKSERDNKVSIKAPVIKDDLD